MHRINRGLRSGEAERDKLKKIEFCLYYRLKLCVVLKNHHTIRYAH